MKVTGVKPSTTGTGPEVETRSVSGKYTLLHVTVYSSYWRVLARTGVYWRVLVRTGAYWCVLVV